MPYRGNYPYYGRTQEALQRLSGTLTEMSRGATAARERKSAHELALAQLGVRRAGVEAGHEIGLLKTRAGQERERGIVTHREKVLQLGRDKLEREQKREDYLKEEITGEEMLRQRLSGETPQNREAIIEEFKGIPSLGSLLSERVPRERWVPFGNKLFGGLEQLEKDRKEGTAKSRVDMDKDAEKYKKNQVALISIGRQLANVQKIKEDPGALISKQLMEKMNILSVDDIGEYENRLRSSKAIYRKEMKEYEKEYTTLEEAEATAEAFKKKTMREVGVPEFEETEERESWRNYYTQ